MSELLYRITPEMVMQGLFPDQPLKNPPLFRDGRNVIFTEGSVQPEFERELLFPRQENSPVTGVLSLIWSGLPTVIAGTAGALYRWDSIAGVSQVGSGYTGNSWSLISRGNSALATNGVDPVQINVGGGFANLGGTPFTWADILVLFKNSVIAFRTSIGDGHVAASDTDDPAEWTANASNFARDFYLRDLDSPIKAAVLFREAVLVYTLNKVSILEFIGSPEVYSLKPLMEGIGAVSKHAVVSAGGQHYGFGPYKMWTTDGVSERGIATSKIHDFVYQNLNKDRLDLVCAWHDRAEHRVVFSYPTLQGYSLAPVFATGVITFTGLPANPTVLGIGLQGGNIYSATPTTPAEVATWVASLFIDSTYTVVAVGDTVVVTAVEGGPAGNAITLSKSGDAGNVVSLSGATLTGGDFTQVWRNDRAVAYNYEDGNWTILSDGFSAADVNQVLGKGLLGNPLGDVLEVGDDDDAPIQGSRSLALPASATISAGFGNLGFGQLGLGGNLNVVG